MLIRNSINLDEIQMLSVDINASAYSEQFGGLQPTELFDDLNIHHKFSSQFHQLDGRRLDRIKLNL